MHVAPKLLGAGTALVGDLGIATIGGALPLTVADVTRLGGDLEIRLLATRHTESGPVADGRS